MLINTHQLNEQQLADLEQLKTICKKDDGSIPNFYVHILNQRRVLPANFIYYDNDQLVGLLSVFFFYETAVEVAVLVHPARRRAGIARQLIQEMLPLVQAHNTKTLIFSCPSHLNDQWLPKLGLSYVHSEYYMERDDLNPLLEYNQPLTYSTATANDIPVLCALDDACFPNKESDPVARFEHLLDDRNYQILIVSQNNHPIGKAHIRWDEHGTTLSDIAILPALQGNKLGSALIAHCINLSLSEGKPCVSLDVETHNLRALNLYTRLGFLIQNACDYWKIEVSQLLR